MIRATKSRASATPSASRAVERLLPARSRTASDVSPSATDPEVGMPFRERQIQAAVTEVIA